MSVVDITTKEQFDNLLKTTPYVALQAHATWCGPCKAMTPLFNKHAQNLTSPDAFTFARFDTDDVPDLAFELGVRAVPAFYFFDHGDKADNVSGANPPVLKKVVEQYAEKAKAAAGEGKLVTDEDF